MCGIVGYIGAQDAAPILLEGLGRLEYRGYDSAGVAVPAATELRRYKAEGRVAGPEPAGCRELRGRDRHRAHPLGDPRRAERRERASA